MDAGGGDHTCVQNRVCQTCHNISIHRRQWSPLLLTPSQTCSRSKSDRPRRLRRDSAELLLPDGTAARHWIKHRTAAGAAAAVRAGCFLFRRYCSFKKRPRRVCGSRSVKNRVRALALQEAAVTAARAAVSRLRWATATIL